MCEVDGFDICATLHRDDCTDSPEERSDCFWPSLDPKAPGYIGAKSKSTLARHMKHAQHVMDSWRRDEWHYFGVAVTVAKNGVQLIGTFDHAVWGIEGNYPPLGKAKRNPNSYFREVANELLVGALESAKAKVAMLCR
jgi:hypothetical protein